jgi:hypothetical protein
MPSGTLSVDVRGPRNAGAPSSARRSPPVVLNDALPGRLRFHLPGWVPAQREMVERRLRMVPGVRKACATPETGNLLLLYDPAVTSAARLLKAAERSLGQGSPKPRGAGRPRRTTGARNASRTPPPPSRSSRLVRALLLNFPSILSLILSLLSCTTPLGAARLGLKAVELAMQLGTATA